MYLEEKLSCNEIEEKTGIKSWTVRRFLIKNGVKILRNHQVKEIDRAWLNKRYFEDKKTCQQIAEEVGCSRKQISRRIKKFGFISRISGPQIGVKFTEEHKKKIGISNHGKPKSLEHRKKLSMIVGERTSNWKGGITPKTKKLRRNWNYKLWREAVFKRDGYKCVLCAAPGDLNADHIKRWSQYPELRFTLSNGRTLCVPCHKKTSNYGSDGEKQLVIQLEPVLCLV